MTSPAAAFGVTSARQNTSAQFPYAARYNGRAWRRTHLPGAALAVSALSNRDLWAIGPTLKTAGRALARQVIVAMHWTGQSWRVIKAPKITTRIRQNYLDGAFAAAAGPREIWWCYQATYGSRSALGLLRWNGTRWHRISVPRAITGVDAMTQDGHGGIWLIADTNPNSLNPPQYWYPYHAGRWTRQLVPSPKAYSNTLFAMADQNRGNKRIGVIISYSPRRG